ncbi:MAG TPA: 50S ribosomal protein L4 [Flavobacteriales bacterium]|jgi:large subunit ribosomal protein L4|nr:50S ribosomal protein L4 [Flavobacteriales bacterium]
MELAVYDINGKETGKKAKLSDQVFGIEPNEHAFYLDVKQYLANQRQGTHKAKERAEITGSTRKIKRQKGTGTARAGSIKSPIFRGGGRVFGPQPRDYGFKLNKKVKKLARKSALSAKVKSESLMILENVNFSEPKTKNYSEFLNHFGLVDQKSLLVIPEENNNVYLSARNLVGAKVVKASDINTYDIANAQKVLLCEGSIGIIEQLLS